MVELDDGSVLDLGYGKIDPHEKHNFVTFDQAAYTVSTVYSTKRSIPEISRFFIISLSTSRSVSVIVKKWFGARIKPHCFSNFS